MCSEKLERPRGAHFELVRDTFPTVVKFPGPELIRERINRESIRVRPSIYARIVARIFRHGACCFFVLASAHLWASHVRRAWKIRWRFGALGFESNASRKTRDIPVFPSFKCISRWWIIQAAILLTSEYFFDKYFRPRTQYFVNLIIFQFYARVKRTLSTSFNLRHQKYL